MRKGVKYMWNEFEHVEDEEEEEDILIFGGFQKKKEKSVPLMKIRGIDFLIL